MEYKDFDLAAEFGKIAHCVDKAAETVWSDFVEDDDVDKVVLLTGLMTDGLKGMDAYHVALARKETSVEMLEFAHLLEFVGVLGYRFFSGRDLNCAEVVDVMTETFRRKNEDYGGSYFELYVKYGCIASAIPIENKCSRLKSLLGKKWSEVNFESVADSFLDLACYAVMYVMCLPER
jgi:hypothetical protein